MALDWASRSFTIIKDTSVRLLRFSLSRRPPILQRHRLRKRQSKKKSDMSKCPRKQQQFVSVSQHVQYQDPESEAARWNSDTIHYLRQQGYVFGLVCYPRQGGYWFVSRIMEKLLVRFSWNLVEGRSIGEGRSTSICGNSFGGGLHSPSAFLVHPIQSLNVH